MRARWIATLAVVALAAAACANSNAGTTKHSGTATTTHTDGGSVTSIQGGNFPPVDAPGVTPTEIRVSGVTSTTNPVGGLYGTAADGVQAYFDMVNSQGGVYGRKLVLVNRHDDQLANNKREVEAIIDQDNAFAVLPVATPFSFSGAPLLVQNGIPTYGWGITDEWSGPANLFGNLGALCNGTGCPYIWWPYVAQKLHKHRMAVLAYNVPASAQCVDTLKASFDKYPTAKIVYATKALPYGGTDMSADVKHMVDDNVDTVVSCLDNNGTLTLAREMRQQGLQAVMILQNAYDHDFMAKNGGFFQGSVVLVQQAPVETTPKFTALQDYITWMDKAGYTTTENSGIGWINADMFVTALRDAGPSFSRQKVIDALNRETAYDAGGMAPPLDWTKQHIDRHYPRSCIAFTVVRNGKFVPQWGAPGKPFVCWDGNPSTVAQAKPYARQ
jgi:ABC-type branched-subunit amino acid transport system substrate-binding protein